MSQDDLIHYPVIREVMERLVQQTQEARDRGAFSDPEEIIASHVENMGLCMDGLIRASEEYAETLLSGVEIPMAILLDPVTMIGSVIARALTMGVVLGRENPR